MDVDGDFLMDSVPSLPVGIEYEFFFLSGLVADDGGDSSQLSALWFTDPSWETSSETGDAFFFFVIERESSTILL